MGFLKKLNFWKKRNNKTPTMVEACVSTEDPRASDAATATTDLTVVGAACTQTETRMDGGGAAAAAAAAKCEYLHEIDIKIKKIQELEEELAVSKRLTADLMLNVSSVEQRVRKYAEEPVILWADDCECKKQVLAVADLLKKFLITEVDARNCKPEATSNSNTNVDCQTQTEGNSRQRDCAGKKTKVNCQTQTKGNSRQRNCTCKNNKVARQTQTEGNRRQRDCAGKNTKVDSQTQTNGSSRQRDCASIDEQEKVRKLLDENKKLSVLVEGYKRERELLNGEKEHDLGDRTTSQMYHIKKRYEEESQRQMQKMRDMRDELLWYKKQLSRHPHGNKA